MSAKPSPSHKKRPLAAVQKAVMPHPAPTLAEALRSWRPLESDDSRRPTLLFLAGPNGAGKSTVFEAARSLLSGPTIFVNADLLATVLRGIPQADQVAQPIADLLRAHMLGAGIDFATETVFSDPAGAKLEYLRTAAANGFRVCLVYISLDSWQLSKARVDWRVSQQGHGVDPAKLKRRFDQSHANAKAALAFVEHGIVLDNSVDATHDGGTSGTNGAYRVVATTHNGRLLSHFPATAVSTSILPPPK